MGSFSLYALNRNDIAGALRYVRQHWDELRPEDFTTLDRLQDHSVEWRRQLDELVTKLQAEKGKSRHAALLHRCAGNYVRVIHRPDGKTMYVPRERALARPDLYRPDGPDEAYKLKHDPSPTTPPTSPPTKPPITPPTKPTAKPPTPPPSSPPLPFYDEQLSTAVDVLKRNLGAARTPPAPSYTETPEPGQAKAQLPQPAQRAIRAHLSTILARIGLHNHGATRKKARRYTIMEKMHAASVRGVHDWDGQILVREDVHQMALAFFQHPQRASQAHAEAAAVLIHEAIHGHSPMEREAYDKAGAFLEESTTELLSRYVMRQHLRGNFNGSAYNMELVGLDGVVRHTLGVGDDKSEVSSRLAHKAALRAASAMRREQVKPATDRFAYVQLFADALGQAVPSTAHIFGGLSETQIAARRQEISKRAYNRITKSFDWWVRHDF